MAALFAALAALGSEEARAGDVTVQGYVWTDLRFTTERPTDRSFPGRKFTRNENQLRLRAVWDIDEDNGVVGVADGRLVFVGLSNAPELPDLTRRETIDPYWIEMDAAYLEIQGFLIDEIDVRFGRQVVTWGYADQINPTDNLNPDDFEDPIMFGQNIGNDMLVATYYHDAFNLTGVVVPVFRAALLPPGTVQALSRPEYNPCGLALDFESFGIDGASDVALQVDTGMPETSLKEMMGAVKLQSRIGEFDVNLSYFRGRDDVPLCIPAELGAQVDFGPPIALESATAKLHYPKMHVLGFEFTGQVPFLGDAGLWMESAVIFPEKVRLKLPAELETFRSVIGLPTDALDGKPFVKVTAGMDYFFTPWLYGNLQYAHGFMDEFGRSRLHDYVIAGVDVKFWNDKATFRLFGIHDFTDQSHVIYPSLITRPFSSTEVIFGGFYYGDIDGGDGRFESPITGGDFVFTRAKVSF